MGTLSIILFPLNNLTYRLSLTHSIRMGCELKRMVIALRAYWAIARALPMLILGTNASIKCDILRADIVRSERHLQHAYLLALKSYKSTCAIWILSCTLPGKLFQLLVNCTHTTHTLSCCWPHDWSIGSHKAHLIWHDLVIHWIVEGRHLCL